MLRNGDVCVLCGHDLTLHYSKLFKGPNDVEYFLRRKCSGEDKGAKCRCGNPQQVHELNHARNATGKVKEIEILDASSS